MTKIEIYSERASKVLVGGLQALAPIVIGPIVVIYGRDLITNPFVVSALVGLMLWGMYLFRKRRVSKREPPEVRMQARINRLLDSDE